MRTVAMMTKMLCTPVEDLPKPSFCHEIWTKTESYGWKEVSMNAWKYKQLGGNHPLLGRGKNKKMVRMIPRYL